MLMTLDCACGLAILGIEVSWRVVNDMNLYLGQSKHIRYSAVSSYNIRDAEGHLSHLSAPLTALQ